MKKKINLILIILVTLIVLYFSMKDDYKTVISTILNINIYFLLLGFFLFGCYCFFKALSIWIMTRNFNSEYRFRQAFRMVLETNFFHAITPFSTGGQPYEIYALKKAKVKLSDATNVSIETFITYQISLVILGSIAIVSNYMFSFYPNNDILSKLVTIGFIVNFLVIVMLFVFSFARKTSKKIIKFFIIILVKLKIVKNKEETLLKFEHHLNEFHRGARILLKNKKSFVGCIILQFISLSSLYLIPFFLIMGSNMEFVNPLIVISTSAYVMLIGAFVPIPGGTGGLEYGFIAFFSNFISGNKVNAIMLIWRFITYYFAMIVGAIILSIKKEKFQCE